MEELHVVDVLREMFKDDDECLDVIGLDVVGSMLYTLSVLQIVTRAIFWDPDQHAHILPMHVPGAKGFKQDPSLKGMKRFLVENIQATTGRSTLSKYRANELFAQLEAPHDERPTTSKTSLQTCFPL